MQRWSLTACACARARAHYSDSCQPKFYWFLCCIGVFHLYFYLWFSFFIRLHPKILIVWFKEGKKCWTCGCLCVIFFSFSSFFHSKKYISLAFTVQHTGRQFILKKWRSSCSASTQQMQWWSSRSQEEIAEISSNNKYVNTCVTLNMLAIVFDNALKMLSEIPIRNCKIMLLLEFCLVNNLKAKRKKKEKTTKCVQYIHTHLEFQWNAKWLIKYSFFIMSFTRTVGGKRWCYCFHHFVEIYFNYYIHTLFDLVCTCQPVMTYFPLCKCIYRMVAYWCVQYAIHESRGKKQKRDNFQ